jgi:hypothetical protein
MEIAAELATTAPEQADHQPVVAALRRGMGHLHVAGENQAMPR